MADPAPSSPMAELSKLAASASPAGNTLIVPPIPVVNMPVSLSSRTPELLAWYQAFHKAMETWREETNFVLRGGRL